MPMRNWNFWSWDRAVKGMQVFLVAPNDIQHVINGVISEIETRGKFRMIDGKLVNSMRVVRVTIESDDGKKITVTRSRPQYQIILKQ